MTFGWPFALAALLLVPVLVAGYVWAGRRRRRQAVTYSSVALIRAAGGRASWKLHLPFGLLVGAFALLALGSARPAITTQVPVAASSVVVALDVSGSMCATDVEPNRLAAAQAAVRTFVEDQDEQVRVGLVLFSGFAQLAVPPTTDREELTRAIDSLTTGRGTTIGSAILKSVDAIAQINPQVAPATGAEGASPGPAPSTPSVAPPSAGPPAAGSPGGFAPEIVVLLTDGANTAGVTPVEAARLAADRGVRVYPIGFGTTNPSALVCSAEQLGGSGFGSGPFGSGGFAGARRGFLVADEPTLRQVAETTGGAYFSASDADQLQDVLDDLPRLVERQTQEVELSAGLVGLATLLVLLAVAAAVRFSAFPR